MKYELVPKEILDGVSEAILHAISANEDRPMIGTELQRAYDTLQKIELM